MNSGTWKKVRKAVVILFFLSITAITVILVKERYTYKGIDNNSVSISYLQYMSLIVTSKSLQYLRKGKNAPPELNSYQIEYDLYFSSLKERGIDTDDTAIELSDPEALNLYKKGHALTHPIPWMFLGTLITAWFILYAIMYGWIKALFRVISKRIGK